MIGCFDFWFDKDNELLFLEYVLLRFDEEGAVDIFVLLWIVLKEFVSFLVDEEVFLLGVIFSIVPCEFTFFKSVTDLVKFLSKEGDCWDIFLYLSSNVWTLSKYFS